MYANQLLDRLQRAREYKRKMLVRGNTEETFDNDGG